MKPETARDLLDAVQAVQQARAITLEICQEHEGYAELPEYRAALENLSGAWRWLDEVADRAQAEVTA